MKILKKITAVLMSALIIETLLTGCESNTDRSPEKTDPAVTEIITTDAGSSEEIRSSKEEKSSEEKTAEPVSTKEASSAEKSEESDPQDVLQNYQNIFVVNKADTLFVRSEPSASGKKLGYIHKYGAGNVLSEAREGTWYQIESGPLTGYVCAEYVTTGSAAETLAKQYALNRARVSVEVANIRKEASQNAAILAAGHLNDLFEIVGEENGFYRIRMNEETEAYLSKDCAKSGMYLRCAVPFDEEEEPSEEEHEPKTEGEESFTVCIDAGHQAHGISEKEPNGPGSSEMKAKLTTGTQGNFTGKPEHEVNLEVALKLEKILKERGYRVVMIRTTADCPKSNAERAAIANESGADCFIRIHCNSLDNPDTEGVINYAPSAGNPYMEKSVIEKSRRFAAIQAETICAVTGAKNLGVIESDTMTGINWCKIPVTIVEMGFMSNEKEDRLLSDYDYQMKLAEGMANGIDRFFN